MRLLVAGGGTGGHLYPGFAIAEAFRERFPTCEILFVGTAAGLEVSLVPRAGYELALVRASRIKGAGLGARVRTVARLPLGILDAFRILRRFRPDLVVSVGGYAAAPTVLAAWLRRAPVVSVEPNAIPGLTNRLLSRLSRRVLVGHERAAERLPRKRVRVVGVPLRRSVVVALTAVLVFGGSQGARFLNERAPGLLAGQDCTVLHQTGPTDLDPVRSRYAALGVEAEVRPYIDDMAAAYAACDLAVTRAGASTVAELAASGTPALLVPFPYAADDHQAANAETLVAVGAARMVRQSAWDEAELARWVASTLDDPEAIRRMSAAAIGAARPDAARDAAAACVELLERRGRVLASLLGGM